jgi:hypothetical protein
MAATAVLYRLAAWQIAQTMRMLVAALCMLAFCKRVSGHVALASIALPLRRCIGLAHWLLASDV